MSYDVYNVVVSLWGHECRHTFQLRLDDVFFSVAFRRSLLLFRLCLALGQTMSNTTENENTFLFFRAWFYIGVALMQRFTFLHKNRHNSTKAFRLWNALRGPLLRIYYSPSRFRRPPPPSFVGRRARKCRKSEINTKSVWLSSVKGDELLVTRADGECLSASIFRFFGLEISRAWWALMWLSSFYCIFAEKGLRLDDEIVWFCCVSAHICRPTEMSYRHEVPRRLFQGPSQGPPARLHRKRQSAEENCEVLQRLNCRQLRF